MTQPSRTDKAREMLKRRGLISDASEETDTITVRAAVKVIAEALTLPSSPLVGEGLAERLFNALVAVEYPNEPEPDIPPPYHETLRAYAAKVADVLVTARPPLREEMVERMAQAIEGPHLPVPPNSKFTLDELRQVRWNQLSSSKQRQRINQARAVLETFTPLPSSIGETEELRKALEPFALACDSYVGEHHVDKVTVSCLFEAGQLRAAKALLASKPLPNRTCSLCGETKSVIEFSEMFDGSQCKECRKWPG